MSRRLIRLNGHTHRWVPWGEARGLDDRPWERCEGCASVRIRGVPAPPPRPTPPVGRKPSSPFDWEARHHAAAARDKAAHRWAPAADVDQVEELVPKGRGDRAAPAG